MHRKLLALVLLLCAFVSVNASEIPSNHDSDDDSNVHFSSGEYKFLNEQIIKLKQLGLSTRPGDELGINFLKLASGDVQIRAIVGIYRSLNEDHPICLVNGNYKNNDDSCKILNSIAQYYTHESMHFRASNILIGRSRTYCISLNDEQEL